MFRLLVITNEPPFPPVHGARVDQWGRFKLLRQHGFRLSLVSWLPKGSFTEDHRSGLYQIFDDVHLFEISRSPAALLRRAVYLPQYSPHVSTRVLSKDKRSAVIEAVRRFGANAVLLEQVHGGVTATDICTALELPLFYRSHNIEFKYMRAQAGAARTIRDKMAFSLASLHLENLEVQLQMRSSAVFDISHDDLEYWRHRGVAKNIWVPPLFPEEPRSVGLTWSQRPFDVVFLGNLNTPNNVAGLEWFLRRVYPLLADHKPEIRVCIAGSRPTSEIRNLIGASGVDLNENPYDADAVWNSGRVLINPILSGSGVNVKSVEMLRFEASLVSTSVGVRGFPQNVRAEFRIADETVAFADEILASLVSPYVTRPQRRVARDYFGPAGIQPMVQAIEAVLAQS